MRDGHEYLTDNLQEYINIYIYIAYVVVDFVRHVAACNAME